jgi:hypothetical protein
MRVSQGLIRDATVAQKDRVRVGPSREAADIHPRAKAAPGRSAIPR